MSKRKKQKRFRMKSTVHHQPLTARIIEMELDDACAYVKQAEELVIPAINEYRLPPVPAFFLLAQYTHVLINGSPQLSVEGATAISRDVLALWLSGLYTPSPEYPFTLAETINDQQGDFLSIKDYFTFFQPYCPRNANAPQGLGKLSAGIVRHPETDLWQIWIKLEERCFQLAAYNDPNKAQDKLEELIVLSRKGCTEAEIKAEYKRLSTQGDGAPKQIPFDMILYLQEHIEDYTIEL